MVVVAEEPAAPDFAFERDADVDDDLSYGGGWSDVSDDRDDELGRPTATSEVSAPRPSYFL